MVYTTDKNNSIICIWGIKSWADELSLNEHENIINYRHLNLAWVADEGHSKHQEVNALIHEDDEMYEYWEYAKKQHNLVVYKEEV